MLADIPDLREALAQADGEELIELLDAFDVAVSYDKPGGILELSALLAGDSFPAPTRRDHRVAGRRIRP